MTTDDWNDHSGRDRGLANDLGYKGGSADNIQGSYTEQPTD